MKLILHILALVARFAILVVGSLLVLFALYLGRVPAMEAYQHAREAHAALPDALDELTRLRTRQARLERELASTEAEARQVEQRAWTIESMRLPDLSARRTELDEQLAAAELELQRLGSSAHELLASAGAVGIGDLTAAQLMQPRVLQLRVTQRLREIELTCGLRFLEPEYTHRFGLNPSSAARCAGAQELSNWASSALAVADQVAAVREARDLAANRLREVAAAVGVTEADLEQARLEANERAAAVETQREALEALLDDLETQQGRIARYEAAAGGFTGWVAHIATDLAKHRDDLREDWRHFWPRALALVLFVMSLPYLWRTFWYYVVAPATSRMAPLALVPAEPPGRGRGSVAARPSERTAAVAVQPGEALLVRATHLRQIETGVSRTRWFYDLSYPFMSFAAGLFMMTEVRVPSSRKEPVRLTVAASGSEAADAYTMRVDLDLGPTEGIVFSPRHLVAVTEGLSVRAEWRVWNVNSWVNGQFRYMLLTGRGSVWFEGYGDVHAETLAGQASHQDGSAYLAYDGRLRSRSRRTETFWPYLFGQTRLFEQGLEGHGTFLWQKASQPTGVTALHRGASAFWSVLGKFVGL